ncbi:hypothetical protein [Natrinema gelatinilyticum]|uniref:hypothetical protein n=1 Tax=Natrinema gelatinilyticum TaxID=2961571 RepID=UPI0020C24CF0|nr:hypothetical protein [Natrinema gelatinilyticum]
MSELSDRLLLLLVAFGSLGTLILAWFGGFLVAGTSGWVETVGLSLLALLLFGILIGIWHELKAIDPDQR